MKKMKKLQDIGDYTALMVMMEEAKLLPLGDVWNEYLSREGVLSDYLEPIKEYEKSVLLKR